MLSNGVFSNQKPTHLMRISYQHSSNAERCGQGERKRWPSHYFFLVNRDDNYHLTHYCPQNPSEIEWGVPVSAAMFSDTINHLDASDWKIVPKEVKLDPSNERGARDYLREKYGFNPKQATVAIEHICNPENISPQ